jgi:hypothetical protein
MDNFDTVKATLYKKTTEDLLSIYVDNDHTEWRAEVFDIIKLILQERHVDIPVQKPAVTKPPSRVFPFNKVWLGIVVVVYWISIPGLISSYRGNPVALSQLRTVFTNFNSFLHVAFDLFFPLGVAGIIYGIWYGIWGRKKQ